LEVDKDVTPFLLKKLNVNTATLLAALDRIVNGYPKVQGGDVVLSRQSATVLNKALSSLKEFGDEFASVEHLLIGHPEGSDNVAQLLKDGGVNQQGPGARDQGAAQG
jgi:ATP-dependent Clp protease ATP-binding subunit ClpB